jgi:hypothetical protein
MGAPVTAKNAMAVLCSIIGMDDAPYKSLSATAVAQAARRDHKHAVKKSAALSAAMVRAINRRYYIPRRGRPRRRPWEFGFGTAVSVAFKNLAALRRLFRGVPEVRAFLRRGPQKRRHGLRLGLV